MNNTTDREITTPIEYSDAVRMVIAYVPGMDIDEGADWCGWIVDTYGRRGYGYSTDEMPTMPQLWREYGVEMLRRKLQQ
jgi:hypothetical protein